ncbi:RNA pseudouridine synthase [Ruficoccus amylovorans]|uniref:RNA pseudouridine synthase n=1 Tax=Ruficoccus amylovorans TaxID=1804625 RepID=A0A842HCD9_9BACT|nr:RNA pseudouridine synthase [Ruficoccus amylovorans]MBC2593920.1 RNA pseudouridine synthase [Ruficoccus amylovorans]
MSFEQWEQRYPLGDKVRVLTVHPAGLIALEKPVGILSHPNSRQDKERSLLKANYSHDHERYYNLNDQGDELFLCHRLDSATSGVILLAQSLEMAKTVRELFSSHRMEKHYLAVVRGRPRPQDVWIDHISPADMPYGGSRSGRPVQMRCRQQLVKLDANRLGLSLIQLIPATGRTHQLRIQCANHGLPILGDRTYGDFRVNRSLARLLGFERLFLHASELAFDFMHAGKLEKFRAESPMPNSFRLVIDQNPALNRVNYNLPPSRHGVPQSRRRNQGPASPRG